MSVKNVVLLIVAILILTTQGAYAHRLHIDWKIGKVQIESFYGGSGTPCQDATVQIYTPDGELLEEGKTDENGKYSFSPVSGINEYKVVLESTHMPGHRAEEIINLKAADSFKENKELPLFLRVFAGLGYLAGLAGVSLAYINWREKRKMVKNENDRVSRD